MKEINMLHKGHTVRQQWQLSLEKQQTSQKGYTHDVDKGHSKITGGHYLGQTDSAW